MDRMYADLGIRRAFFWSPCTKYRKRTFSKSHIIADGRLNNLFKSVARSVFTFRCHYCRTVDNDKFSQSIRHVLINDAVVRGEQPALYWSRGEGAQFWTAWAEEEAIEKKLHEKENQNKLLS